MLPPLALLFSLLSPSMRVTLMITPVVHPVTGRAMTADTDPVIVNAAGDIITVASAVPAIGTSDTSILVGSISMFADIVISRFRCISGSIPSIGGPSPVDFCTGMNTAFATRFAVFAGARKRWSRDCTCRFFATEELSSSLGNLRAVRWR